MKIGTLLLRNSDLAICTLEYKKKFSTLHPILFSRKITTGVMGKIVKSIVDLWHFVPPKHEKLSIYIPEVELALSTLKLRTT
jgi:hypothetical protein